MQKQANLQELVERILDELKRLRYSEVTLAGYRRRLEELTRFAEARGEESFSEAAAKSFIREKFDCEVDDIFTWSNADSAYLRQYLRCSRVLLEFQLSGTICARIPGKLQRAVLPDGLQAALDSFDDGCRRRSLSQETIRTRGERVKRFLLWEAERGVVECSGICSDDAAEYVMGRASLHERTVQTLLTTLRCFLRHLYLQGLTESDLSSTVPAPKRYCAPSLPELWRQEDIDKLFSNIDRGNPAGKRDYAMLLMVARLGLRPVDVRELRLGDIRWADKEIRMVQHKTRMALTLPLPDDLGWALIDYLEHARPESADDHVFLQMIAPFAPFSTSDAINNVLVRRSRQAGIERERGGKTVHSLRHSLASRMLGMGVPLDDIMRVLGHVNRKTTSIYLHMDDEALALCALDPGAVVA